MMRCQTVLLAPTIWIQLCGELAVRVGAQRVENRLPGRQGRALFAHLARLGEPAERRAHARAASQHLP